MTWPDSSRQISFDYTQGSSWFSDENGRKGAIAVGQLADVTMLTEDYFSVPEESIKGIESVLTIVDGKVVYAVGRYFSSATNVSLWSHSLPSRPNSTYCILLILPDVIFMYISYVNNPKHYPKNALYNNS